MPEKKLNICHVITRMIVGGAQENTLLSIFGQIEMGHNLYLLTGPSPGPEGELLSQRELPDFETILEPHLIRELNPYHDVCAYVSMRRLFKSRQFDVVHTHSSKAGVIARAAARAAGVPFVCHTVHGQAFHAYEKAWKNRLYITAERWAAKRCDRIFSVAQAMIEQCVEAGIAPREKYRVVYSGMELEPLLNTKAEPDLRTSLGIPENVPVVGTIARLFPLKGYEFLIPAATQIVKKHPDTRFLIVGDGIMKEQIQNQIAKLGLSANFAFAGLVPPSEVCRYTALMDVLVHLSLREGLPRTVVQALASGKPAVAFALDGTPEILRDGETGYLIKPEDINAVADAVNKLLTNPEAAREMGENGRELVSKLFDWRKMARILIEEYQSQLSQLNKSG